jgi:RNA polymerase sigma-70 factor (ECF subfamily)
MDENPKRRKHKDNPYTLKKVGNKFFVSFKDGMGISQEIEINEKQSNAFNEFELEDLSEMNEFDRHIEQSKIYENNLEKRAKEKSISMEDEFIQKATFEELKRAIERLEEPYRKRIILYYFNNKNETEIADIEGISQQAISKTLHIALEKLKEFLKNIQN